MHVATLAAPGSTLPASPPRRLIAAGIIRKANGSTIRITPAGVTGSIRPAGAR